MKKLKAEWWELWWVKKGERPIFCPMYGMPIPHWVPDGCHPSLESALEDKRKRQCKYDRIIHIRRYTK